MAGMIGEIHTLPRRRTHIDPADRRPGQGPGARSDNAG
jgi:hypothetical protein